MAVDNEPILKKAINASGFLFQLAIEEAAKHVTGEKAFDGIVREHPWKNPENGTEGFIDLVLNYGCIRFVIECKRPRGGTWIFLVPSTRSSRIYPACFGWSHHLQGKVDLFGYDDFSFNIPSLESEFCILEGQKEDGKTMLERISSLLLDSIYSLIQEELAISQTNGFMPYLIYVPVIVTTAKIAVCKFDTTDINLSDGTLDKEQYEIVPFIRFRKSLATEISPFIKADSLSTSKRLKERTILIINADEFIKIVKSWDIDKVNPFTDGFPWDRVRKSLSK